MIDLLQRDARIVPPLEESPLLRWLAELQDGRRWRESLREEVEPAAVVQAEQFPDVGRVRHERRRGDCELTRREERFRTLVAGSSDVVFQMTPDWSVMQSLVGRGSFAGEQAAGGEWMRRYIPSESRGALQSAIDAAIRGRDVLDLEHRVVRKGVRAGWVHTRAVPMLDHAGEVLAWVGMASDVTQRKEAEQALSAREQLLRTITENSADDIFILDRSHRLEYLNPAGMESLQRFFGGRTLAAEAVIGRTVSELLGDDDAARNSRSLSERVMASGRASHVEEVIRSGGRVRHRLTLRTPIRGADGEVVGLVGIGRDITQRKREETARLEGLDRQRDTLVREVHHRIKNHLQGVLGLLRLQVGRRPELAEPLEAVMAQVRAISGVYGLRGPQAGSQVDFGSIVALLVRGAAGSVRVQYEPPGGEPILLGEADAVPVALVVNELVANALKHLAPSLAPDDGQQVQVSVRARAGAVRIRVRNAPARLPEDFDFARRAGIGTGLQLVSTLLPSRGAHLDIVQDGDAVLAELVLREPVVAPACTPAGN